MRVFQSCWVAIRNKTIAVRDSLDVIDAFLAEHHIPYARLFSPTDPQLSPGDIRALFKKIPRPHNPGVIEVWFDGVDWFRLPSREPCLREDVPAAFLLSNSIRLIRYAGNTFYRLDFFIELTDLEDGRRCAACRELTRLLQQRFGQLHDGSIEVAFTPLEREELQAKRAAIAPRIEALQSSLPAFGQGAGELWAFAEDLARGSTHSTTVKKPLLRCFPKPQFSYRYDGEPIVTKRTAHGYQLSVRFSSPPGHSTLAGGIWLRGAHFFYQFSGGKGQIVRRTQEQVDHFIKEHRRMADRIEDELDAPLFELFGPTPDWFFP